MGRRALAYLRRPDEIASILNDPHIRSWLTEKDIDLIGVVCDLPETSVADKAARFGEILVRLHAGEAEAIVIEQMRSLSEDKIEQEIVLCHCRSWDIQVFCITDPELCSGDPERQLLREFCSRQGLSKRLSGLRLQGERIAARSRGGKTEGAKPYGELAGEAPVLRHIQELHRQGLSNTEISRRLNESKISPRRGKQWHPTTVANVLGARRAKALRAKKSRNLRSQNKPLS